MTDLPPPPPPVVETVSDTLDDVESGRVVTFSSSPQQQEPQQTSNDDDRPSLIRGHSRWNVVRTSTVVDLETGVEEETETHVEEIQNHREAMGPGRRLASQLLGRLGTSEKKADDDQQAASSKQYRLTSKRTKEKWTCWQRITGVGPNGPSMDAGKDVWYIDWTTTYLRWTFRTSFLWLLVTSALAFWGLAAIFAGLIHGIALYQPECVYVGGLNYTEAGNQFGDAFALSWTTLSTVGYGHIFPQLAILNGPRCFGINLFCTVEAFVGVLFAGFMAAILVGKVSRVSSFAAVQFSDPIVIRYGSGVMPKDDEEDDSVSGSPRSTSKSFESESKLKLPCPILEFRIINKMHSIGGGEIVNSSINVVASTLASKTEDFVQSSVTPRSHKKQLLAVPKAITKGTEAITKGTAGRLVTEKAQQVTQVAAKAGKTTGVTQVAGHLTSIAGKTTGLLKTTLLGETIQEGRAYDPDDSQRSQRSGFSEKSNVYDFSPTMVEATRDHQVVDEGSNLIPRRIFFNLDVETPAHPFFKRVWNVRHALDQNSPLLSQEAKNLIAENGGFWPQELNGHQAVRENIHFHEIIVNFSGTGHATGSAVYAQKVYAFVDVNVGYSFVGVLCHDRDGALMLDDALLNDVVEQNGGGGEPFTDVRDTDLVGAAVEALEDVAEKTRDVTTGTRERVVTAVQDAQDLVKKQVGDEVSGVFTNIEAVSQSFQNTDDVKAPSESEKLGKKDK